VFLHKKCYNLVDNNYTKPKTGGINMQEFLLLCSLMSFSCFIVIVTDLMIKDKNAVIRFIGYMIDVIMAILVFYLILYYYFDIKLLEIFL